MLIYLTCEAVVRLRAQYRTLAQRLRKTGEGIQDSEPDSSAEVNEFMVPADGPDHSTSQYARNIWGKVDMFSL